MMDIYAPQGTKVRYLGQNGYPSQVEAANKWLTIGEVYTVARTVVHGWSTDVYLEEVLDTYFNSVLFAEVSEA